MCINDQNKKRRTDSGAQIFRGGGLRAGSVNKTHIKRKITCNAKGKEEQEGRAQYNKHKAQVKTTKNHKLWFTESYSWTFLVFEWSKIHFPFMVNHPFFWARNTFLLTRARVPRHVTDKRGRIQQNRRRGGKAVYLPCELPLSFSMFQARNSKLFFLLRKKDIVETTRSIYNTINLPGWKHEGTPIDL